MKPNVTVRGSAARRLIAAAILRSRKSTPFPRELIDFVDGHDLRFSRLSGSGESKAGSPVVVGGEPCGALLVAFESVWGSVWVSAPGAPLIRIDRRSNRAVQRFTGDGGGAVLTAHGSVWIAAGSMSTWRLDPLLVAALRP